MISAIVAARLFSPTTSGHWRFLGRCCFIVPTYSRSTETPNTRASNFPMNPTAASHCSAAAGYDKKVSGTFSDTATWGPPDKS